jgi:hypothetical protein
MMTTPTAPFAALSASGLSYERLVSIFKLVQDRATNASASDILDFLQDNLSHEKFNHLPLEQRARMQVSLRSLQEYALDVWRAQATAQLSQAEAFSLVNSPSGVFSMLNPSSGSYPALNPSSGSFNAVMHTPMGPMPVIATPAMNRAPSGAYAAVNAPQVSYPVPQISLPQTSPAGVFQAVTTAPSFSPMTKRSFGQRCKESLKSLFGKTSATPQLPNLSMDVTNAMLSPGE